MIRLIGLIYYLVSSVWVDCSVLNNDLFRLDIVHYNDFHARFEETSMSYPICTSNDSACLGGYARLCYEIKSLLKEKPGALLLNAGDVFQGTYWYTFLKYNITQQFINMLPHDAHTIGNHDFDDGIAGLAPYLAALQAPVVVANIDTSLEPSLDKLYKPHIVIERQGRKIGIIGVTIEAKSSLPEKVQFLNPFKTVQMQAQLLTDQEVDIIIVLSHCGLNIDKKIASSVGENVDVIVGGHTHSLLWNGKSPSNEFVDGPYPVLVKSEANPDHEVIILTANYITKYVGNFTAYFDLNGAIKGFSGEPVFLNRSIPEDEEIKALLAPYAEKLHVLVDENVGFAEEELLANNCGSQECAIGNLIADAFLCATEEMNVSNLTSIAFTVRNMIRASIPKGEITRGEVINVLPFGSTVKTFSIQGKYLIDAFEKCMTVNWVAKPFDGPLMPHVAGLQLTLNLTDGLTIKVLVKEDNEYVLLDLQKMYQVTTLNFIMQSSNGFDMLQKYGKDITTVGEDSEVVEKYICRQSPIIPMLDNRLTVIN